MNALITGKGQIGRALARHLSFRGDRVSFFSSKDKRSTFPGRASKSDVVFLAIPTRDTGEAALEYIRDAVHAGKPVITCEKGSLAYHFEEVRPYLKRVGYTASVGGGSRMLSLFSFPHLGLKRMTGIVNGTLNFLFSECARGQDPYLVLTRAQKLGLCEPGNNSLSDVVNAEVKDILLKTAILFNSSEVSKETLSASEFGEIRVSEKEILHQLGRKTMRFAVSIGREQNSVQKDGLYDCLHLRKGEWHIRASLTHVSSLPFNPFPKLYQNALIIEDAAGLTQIIGPGAGPVPTAATMIMDAMNLINQ